MLSNTLILVCRAATLTSMETWPTGGNQKLHNVTKNVKIAFVTSTTSLSTHLQSNHWMPIWPLLKTSQTMVAFIWCTKPTSNGLPVIHPRSVCPCSIWHRTRISGWLSVNNGVARQGQVLVLYFDIITLLITVILQSTQCTVVGKIPIRRFASGSSAH